MKNWKPLQWLCFSLFLGLLNGCGAKTPDTVSPSEQAANPVMQKEITPKLEAAQDGKTMNDKPLTAVNVPAGKEVATFAGGCFWCTEAIFENVKGVEKVESGYAGGDVPDPTYEQACSGRTGHAEAIQVTFDPKLVSFHDLAAIFFSTHDPTTLNRQGNDSGTQYRSAVFYHDDAQKQATEAVIKEVTAEKLYPNPIVTEVTAFTNFYKAEDYHQSYFDRNGGQPYCSFIIAPKVAKFRAKYRDKLKQ